MTKLKYFIGLFLVLLIFRYFQSKLLWSQFSPDEYYQSQEIGYLWEFGNNESFPTTIATWEFLIDTPIRSVLYPALMKFLYAVHFSPQLFHFFLLITCEGWVFYYGALVCKYNEFFIFFVLISSWFLPYA